MLLEVRVEVGPEGMYLAVRVLIRVGRGEVLRDPLTVQ